MNGLPSAAAFWEVMTTPGPARVAVGGVEVGRGSRVRLSPRAGGDVFDLALAGRIAVVEDLETDEAGTVRLAVTLEDDPGREFGEGRFPGHRFFFALDEVEPLADEPAADGRTLVPRVLVAGIGNLFLGDDGFGVAVAARLVQRPWPAGVEVADFGIRGLDLAYALQGIDAVVLVDAVPRGGAPGTLYVLEPEVGDGPPAIEPHGMDPVRVLRFARTLGPLPGWIRVVGCEPARVLPPGGDEMEMELSPPVAAAVDRAAVLVERVVADLLAGWQPAEPSATERR